MKLLSANGEITDKKKMEDAYGAIPSSPAISALQSRSKEPVHMYETENGYVLDEFHSLELSIPQLHLITNIEPLYVRNICVTPEVLRKVAEAHPDVYIVNGRSVYIDPTIYRQGELVSYAREFFRLSYVTQLGMSKNT